MPKTHDHDSDSDSDIGSPSASVIFSDISMAPSNIKSDTSSRTSVDASMRSPSPTQSVMSVTSSVRAQSYRYEHGRGVNNYSEVYRLPADDVEIDRLDAQHQMVNKIMGKYAPPLPEVMADNVPGETKAVLDLGCGSGTWIMDVAREFPNCSAVAVDLVPMQNLSMPPNLRSEVDDLNLGLEHFYGDFDVVHARLICTGIKDYANLIDQVSRVLRPGGLFDFMEFGFQIFGTDRQVIQVATSRMEAPWLPRWMTLAYMAAQRRGGSLDAAGKIHGWVRDVPEFEDIVHNEYWIPASPWVSEDNAEHEKLNEFGKLMRDDILAFLSAGRPLLLGSNLPESIIKELEENSIRELMEARTPYYIRLHNVYARKRA